jgi:hypothetical protein
VAATEDILTLAEGRSALRQGTSTANDTDIALLITASSVAIDRGIGPVVIRTITSDSYDGEERRRQSMIQLRYWPVVTMTTVVEDGTTLAAGDYHVDKEKGQVWRRSGDDDYWWEDGRDNLVFTYTAGRYAATANVDPWYKHGCRLLLRHQWRSEQWNTQGIGATDYEVPQVAFPSFSIPKAVIDWYGPLWRLASRDPSRPTGGFV